MQPVAALLDTPLAKKVTDSVGNEVMELSDDLVNQLIDGLLNKHKATKDKEIQKLLLNPLKKLTPEFISSLVDRSQEQPIILIFEKCEKMGTENGENCKIVAQDEESSLLESWFCEMFLSRKNEFLKKEKHNVRFIISSRKSLTKRNDWNQLKEYCSDIYYEYSLKPFNKAQTKDFLKNKLSNKLRKKLSKTNESLTQEKIEEKIKEKIEKEKENYYKITHGHPKYLELICNQINKEQNLDYFEINDYSKINQNIAEDFLVDLSRSQKKVIKLVSCRRWLDRILIENLLQILKDTFTQEDFPADFPWFNWVKRRDFIFLRDNRYQVDELAQQVLGRCLFQQDREQFYGGHEQFAKYFRDKADELLQDKPTITKYNNSEWCEYMGEYLYHACFAQMKEFEVKFLEHLFALSYLNKEDVLKNSCKAIIEQANLKDQPLINSTNKKFLETLEFIATYSWVAFELNSKTGYGKYQAKIEATVHLCKNLLEKLESGIGKVAVLEFILKNLPVNCSEQERKEFEQSLSTEIDRTASNIDPNFSSRLYLQSAIWQTGNSDNILDWCDKAIKFKSNNANAWYRQGKFFQKQAKEILQKDKKDKAIIENLYTALDMYDKALKIQPFDHRFWKFRADVLVDLGDNFLSVDKQILDLVDSEKSQGQKDNNCSNKSDCLDGAVCECQERSDCDNGNDCENKSGSILQRAAY
ncbi:MAG: tetratricopeptide repeat protein [Xenococcus sp. (in: cyanobacteria)]